MCGFNLLETGQPFKDLWDGYEIRDRSVISRIIFVEILLFFSSGITRPRLNADGNRTDEKKMLARWDPYGHNVD